MSTQNPIIPTPLQAQGIDAVIQDLQTHLDFDLSWLTVGMGQGYRLAKVRTPQNIVFLPEVYLGTTQNKYFSATPDNDKVGQSIFVLGTETLPNYQLGFFGYLEYEMSILFTANLKLIDSTLLETEDFTEHLIADVRQSIIRNLLGKAYRVTIDNVVRGFENTYSDFDIANDRGISYLPLTHFRLNCTVQVKEDCPPTTLNRCTAILQNLTTADLLDCILPTYDFADPTTQAAVTPQQQTDLQTWLCMPVPPTFDYSFNFLGVNEYIRGQTGGVYSLNYTNPFSISIWVTPTSFASNIGLLGKVTGQTGYSVFVLTNGKVLIDLRAGAYVNGLCIAVFSNTALTLGVLNNVVITYTGVGNSTGIKMYINGVAVTFTIDRDTITASILNANPIEIGATTAYGIYSNASFNSARMWNIALSAPNAVIESTGTAGKPNASPVSPANSIMDTDFDSSIFGVDLFAIADSSGASTGYKTVNVPFSSRFVQP